MKDAVKMEKKSKQWYIIFNKITQLTVPHIECNITIYTVGILQDMWT